jgi:hypothetical protein
MHSTRPTNTAPSRFWLWYLAIGLALIGVSYAPLPSSVSTLLFNSFCLSAAVAMCWRGGDRRATGQRTWQLLALGIALLAAGDFAWFYDEVVRGIESPFPALADALYLSAYPLIAAALVMLSRHRGQGSDHGVVLDGTIIGLGYGVVAWFFFLEPYLGDSSYSLLERLVSAAYPGMDILVVGAAALLLFTPGPRPPAFLLLIGGTALYVAADVFYSRALITETYVFGSWMDTAWMLGALGWGAAAPTTRISMPG